MGRAIREVKHRFTRTVAPYPYRKSDIRTRSLYIHVPKTAGTSVLEAMGAPTTGRVHCTWRSYYESEPDWFSRFYKFSFVRNPWDRIESVFRYLTAGGNRTTDLALVKSEINRRDFESFVLEVITPWAIWRHPLFWPQYVFVCDELFAPRVDYIGKFENLDEDFAVVAKQLNLSPSLSHLNKGKGRTLACGWTAEMIERIGSVYAPDVEIFGYRPPIVA